MKKSFLPILLFAYIVTSAQETPLEKANKLIEDKKYQSAMEVLVDADPTNHDPDIAIAKTELFLDYFVTSIMHNLFALTDLEPDQDILDIRGSEGNYSMYAFSPDTILTALIREYPDDYRLHKTLGYYFHEVHLKYPQNWLLPDSVVVKKFRDYYTQAYEHGIYDYWSLYGIGYACLIGNDLEEAIPFLEKSAELKDDYPSSHYNLAYAYLYTDQREKAIASAQKAMDLYDYPPYKADAARMIAVVYDEQEEYEKALEYYYLSDEIMPDDYYTLHPILDLEIQLNKETYPERTRQFFMLAPDNPTIYEDLMRIGSNSILRAYAEVYAQDDLVTANLFFFIANIQFEQEDFDHSKQNFEEARKLFESVFEQDHPVFEVIDSYLSEM